MPEVVEIHWKFGYLAACEMKSAKMTWGVTSSSLNYFAFEEEEKARTALKPKLIIEVNGAVT